MPIKKELRAKLKNKRKILHNTEDDNEICESLVCSNMYIDADLVLFYAAAGDEINIDCCVYDAFALGKKVAFPRCTDDKGNMKFYYINSLDELESGFFGIREPCESAAQVTDFTGSICVVPAIAYDKSGYRLGYGKGYYDRFLQNYGFISVGLCYNELIIDELPADEHDIPVDYIITQYGVFRPVKK